MKMYSEDICGALLGVSECRRALISLSVTVGMDRLVFLVLDMVMMLGPLFVYKKEKFSEGIQNVDLFLYSIAR